MAYSKDRATKTFIADIKDRALGRLRVSLKTTNAREAGRRHAAVEALVRAGRRDLVDQLRARRLNVEAVTECYERQRPWDSLSAREAWPTLGAAVAEYLAWIEAHPERSEGTRIIVTSRLTAMVRLLGGARHVDTLTLADVEGDAEREGLRAQLLATGIADATLAQYLRALATLYRWLNRREERRALEERRAPRALHLPVDRELIPRVTSKRVRFLEAPEASAIVANTAPRLTAAVGAGLVAGLRIDEVVHLRPADVDLELGILYVQPKPTPWHARRKVWKPKSRHSVREIPLEPSLAAVFRAHLATYASEAWCFPAYDRDDRPMSRTGLTRAFQQIVGDAGLVTTPRDPATVTFHTLRHTFASWLVMEGVDLFTVAQLLGHASIDQVQATYAHLSPDHRARAVARLAQRFTLPPMPTESAPPASPASPDAESSQAGTQET